MILKTTDLYHMQEKLDERILIQHQRSRQETAPKRLLALLVEVGELANETRCFKFWSTKGSSEKKIVLEEYVDGIHFLLSIGLDLNCRKDEIQAQEVKQELSTMFMDVYELTTKLRREPSRIHYEELCSYYVALGDHLGFCAEDIRNAYFEKNAENFKRQDQNY